MSNPLATKKKYSKKSDPEQLVSIIDEQNEYIQKLQRQIKQLKEKLMDTSMESESKSKEDFYRKKLEQQLQVNELAKEGYQEINLRIVQLSKLIENNTHSKAKIVNKDQSPEKSGLKSMSLLSASIQTISITDLQKIIFNNFKNLQTVTKNIFQLQQTKITDNNLKEEIRSLQNQLKATQVQKQQVKGLLEQNQKEKVKLLASIHNATDQKIREEIQKMSKQDLINYINKIYYKMNEIQRSKKQMIKQNQKLKNQDILKYKQILNQVKEAKEGSRMGSKLGRTIS